MQRRVNFHSICFAIGLSVLLIVAVTRYTDNATYKASGRNIKNFRRTENDGELLPQPIPTNPYDVSPNIDEILEKTRVKIKLELSNYNFTQTGAKNLHDLVLESGGRPQRSLIMSTWRSGSTFLGDIVNAMPANFYHYEPFLNYQINTIRGPPHADIAISTIKDMFNCVYKDMEDYFTNGKNHLYQFSHNTRLWDHCKYKKELCFDADFTARFCRLFPFQSMKIVRLRLWLVREILEDHKLNVRVVLLIRDPRGVMHSRQNLGFCQRAPDCWQPELLCADMISDYIAAGKLQQLYPDRFMVLRLEELSLEPHNTTLQLYKFLGLHVMPPVHEFLNSHTNVEVSDFRSTYRVSRDVPFRWKTTLKYDYVQEIQTACKQAMDLWGYRVAYNATHMASEEFHPLEEYSISPSTGDIH